MRRLGIMPKGQKVKAMKPIVRLNQAIERKERRLSKWDEFVAKLKLKTERKLEKLQQERRALLEAVEEPEGEAPPEGAAGVLARPAEYKT